MKHYYFKFWGNNEGLREGESSYGIEKVELAIYYDIDKELIWLAQFQLQISDLKERH
jgi:hypothetical protein